MDSEPLILFTTRVSRNCRGRFGLSWKLTIKSIIFERCEFFALVLTGSYSLKTQ